GVDAASGRPFLAMEYLVGEDLGRFLRGPAGSTPGAATLRQFSPRATVDRARTAMNEMLALKIVVQAARGVAAAHQQGIVHRDIKPGNLFLTQCDGEVRVKVLDFGIARVFEESAAPGGVDLTRSGGMLGSPGYMAPEQVRGERELGPATDVWALGIVLYELLAGHLPHARAGRAIGAQLVATCSEPAPALVVAAPHVRAATAEVVHAALEMDPRRRTPTAIALLDALVALLPGGEAALPVDLLEDDAAAMMDPGSRATLGEKHAPATALDAPSPGACALDAELLAWEEGALAQDERARLRLHAETCEDCRSLIAATVPTSARGEALRTSEERYRIGPLIGAGAMGSVHRAYDRQLHREVALKLLHPEWEGEQTARERLLREARAMARLRHPQVVQVFDAGVLPDGRVFIAMEHVAGPTLRAFLRVRPLPQPQCIALLAGAGQALASAHAQGIVHRDFKPDNVFVEEVAGAPRLTVGDFGLAKMHARRSGVEEPAPESLTRGAEAVGTPLYMAPEVLRGGEATAASDQFSFAVTLYECLLHERPFQGRTLRELAEAMERGLPATHVAGLPPPVGRALQRALAPHPSQRYPTMEALLADLASGTATSPPSSRSLPVAARGGGARAWAAGGVALAVLGAALAVASGRGKARATVPPGACASMTARIDAAWGRAAQERHRRAFADVAGPDGRFPFERLDAAMKARTRELHGATEELCASGLTSGEQHCVEWSIAEAESFVGEVNVVWTATQVFTAADAVLALPPTRCHGANVEAWSKPDADAHFLAAYRYGRGEALSGNQLTRAWEDPTTRRDAGAADALPFLRGLLVTLESEAFDGPTEKGDFDDFDEELQKIAAQASDQASGRVGDKQAADRIAQALGGDVDASPDRASLGVGDASTPSLAPGPRKEVEKAIVLAGALDMPGDAQRARALRLYFQGTRQEATDVARLLEGQPDVNAFAYAEAARIGKVLRQGERPTSDAAQACLAGETFDLACHRIVSALYAETQCPPALASRWAALTEQHLGPFHPAHGEARLHEAESLWLAGRPREAAEAAQRARAVLERHVREAPAAAFRPPMEADAGDRLGPLPTPVQWPGRIARTVACLARAYVVLAETTQE
ncbi:MAG: serine/threonine protein kinase, partial [Polyangiaceae bacterium]|nr:serine/threonine protein kinase [Polyangiaceae bacterium]